MVPIITELSYNELLQLRLQVDTAVSAIEADAEKKLRAGTKVPGFELKKGRMVRKLADEAVLLQAVETELNMSRDDLFNKTLLGIPAIETLLIPKLGNKAKVAEFMQQHVLSGRSKSTLVYVGGEL